MMELPRRRISADCCYSHPLPATGRRAAPCKGFVSRTLCVALCGALLLLNGCSALRVGYNQADWLAYRWVAAYADFDEAQSARVRKAITEWFAWNRLTQLPDYAELLLRIDAEMQADTNPQRVCAWWSELRTRIDRAAERVVPVIAEVGATLTPAQLESIERRYAKTNLEYRDDFMQSDLSVRAGETLKRVVNRAESIYGDVDEFQRERIDRWLADSPYDPQLTDIERRHRQQDALQTLRRLTAQPYDAAATKELVRGWLTRIGRSPRASHRVYSDSVMLYNCRLAASIHNSTSASQRKTASQKLRGWAADMRLLAAETKG